MKYPFCLLLLAATVTVHAQTDVFQESNIKLLGKVKGMHLSIDALRLENDTLVVAENKGIHHYSFYNDNKVVTDTNILNNGHDTLHYTYSYDKKGHLLTITPDKIKFHIQYEYNGNDIKHVGTIDDQGNALIDLNYTYFKDSTVIKQRSGNVKIAAANSTLFYDDKHKHVTVIHNSDTLGNVMSSTVLAYDTLDNPAKQTVYDTKGHVVYESVYEYVYDDHQNFTQRNEYRNGTPFSVTTREIVYK